MGDAASPKNEKSFYSATIHRASAFAAMVTQIRRLLGSCVSATRQDVLVSADADLSSRDENEHAAWLAYSMAKKKKDFTTKAGSDGTTGEKNGNSDSPAPDGFNRHAVERNRRPT